MTVRLNVNITNDLNERLDLLAEQSGTTKSELLRKAIALMDLAVTERVEHGNKLGILDKNQRLLREIVGV